MAERGVDLRPSASAGLQGGLQGRAASELDQGGGGPGGGASLPSEDQLPGQLSTASAKSGLAAKRLRKALFEPHVEDHGPGGQVLRPFRLTLPPCLQSQMSVALGGAVQGDQGAVALHRVHGQKGKEHSQDQDPQHAAGLPGAPADPVTEPVQEPRHSHARRHGERQVQEQPMAAAGEEHGGGQKRQEQDGQQEQQATATRKDQGDQGQGQENRHLHRGGPGEQRLQSSGAVHVPHLAPVERAEESRSGALEGGPRPLLHRIPSQAPPEGLRPGWRQTVPFLFLSPCDVPIGLVLEVGPILREPLRRPLDRERVMEAEARGVPGVALVEDLARAHQGTPVRGREPGTEPEGEPQEEPPARNRRGEEHRTHPLSREDEGETEEQGGNHQSVGSHQSGDGEAQARRDGVGEGGSVLSRDQPGPGEQGEAQKDLRLQERPAHHHHACRAHQQPRCHAGGRAAPAPGQGEGHQGGGHSGGRLEDQEALAYGQAHRLEESGEAQVERAEVEPAFRGELAGEEGLGGPGVLAEERAVEGFHHAENADEGGPEGHDDGSLHSISNRESPPSTAWPASTKILRTVPAESAWISFSIFMASSTTTP